jgi:plasmid replication DNA-binding protein KfrA
MHSEHDKDGLMTETFTGRDILYREGSVGLLDVQRAADALLRLGRKPSVAAIREHLGGGSPNTITPLLAKYWEKLGSRLGDGPESLERVPEALARVTELLWRRALEEARERLNVFQGSDKAATAVEDLQKQIMKLSVALAEARAMEGEQLTHLSALSKERESLRAERGSLLALLKSTQVLLEQQSARVAALERERTKARSTPTKPTSRARAGGAKAQPRRSRSTRETRNSGVRNRAKPKRAK